MFVGRALRLAQVLFIVAPTFILYGYNQAGIGPLSTLQSWYDLIIKVTRKSLTVEQGPHVPGNRFRQYNRTCTVTEFNRERHSHRFISAGSSDRSLFMHLLWRAARSPETDLHGSYPHYNWTSAADLIL